MYILSLAMIVFIGPKSDHCLLLSVTNKKLKDCCSVDLTDVTLAFEDVNSNLLDVVSVANVYAEDRADDSYRDSEAEFWSRH